MFRNRLVLGALGLMTIAAAAPPAMAHSLKDVEAQLQEREIYMEPTSEAAPKFTLEDAEGRKVSLDDFKDKVVVLHFVWARCTDVCPLQSQMIGRIQEQINQTPMREQVQFVTIATDTEGADDTVAIMRDYGEIHGLDPVNWVFLSRGRSAEPNAGIALAKAYGLKFVYTEDGSEQMHAVVTYIIDRNGVIRARFHGLKFEPTSLITYVNALVNDVHGPGEAHARSLWDKVLGLF